MYFNKENTLKKELLRHVIAVKTDNPITFFIQVTIHFNTVNKIGFPAKLPRLKFWFCYFSSYYLNTLNPSFLICNMITISTSDVVENKIELIQEVYLDPCLR